MFKKANYLVRLDDACPTMDANKWRKMEEILDAYGILPLVGIIPNNLDQTLMIDAVDDFFWEKAQGWKKKGWSIALHGFDHVYITKNGGINPVHQRSEFAGVPLQEQEEKIEKGFAILKEKKIEADYFFAPSHTFDINTLKALRTKTDIRKISDTMGRNPYKNKGFVFYPQQFGYFREINFPGYYTFCLHPNTMKSIDFERMDLFLKKHQSKFISFDVIEIKTIKNKSLEDRLLSVLYFLWRKLKKQIN
jgi:predicted deacetylase